MSTKGFFVLWLLSMARISVSYKRTHLALEVEGERKQGIGERRQGTGISFCNWGCLMANLSVRGLSVCWGDTQH